MSTRFAFLKIKARIAPDAAGADAEHEEVLINLDQVINIEPSDHEGHVAIRCIEGQGYVALGTVDVYETVIGSIGGDRE